MLYNILDDLGNSLKMKGLSTAIMFLASFVLVVICLKVFRRVLPKDQGREFAVNGSLSEGCGYYLRYLLCFPYGAVYSAFSGDSAVYGAYLHSDAQRIF